MSKKEKREAFELLAKHEDRLVTGRQFEELQKARILFDPQPRAATGLSLDLRKILVLHADEPVQDL